MRGKDRAGADNLASTSERGVKIRIRHPGRKFNKEKTAGAENPDNPPITAKKCG
jgi:hypothetical protein